MNASPVIASFVIGVLLGAGGMYQYSSVFDVAAPSTEQIERLKTPGAPAATFGQVLYENKKYGFSLSYPPELVFKEFDEGNDSWTVVFQKPGEQIGFQIYITPHQGDTISGDVIRRDVPSGVIEDLKEEQIRSDILAATFWSRTPLIGRSREIWFLHGGYIFEFTAYAPAEVLLRDTIQTIQFTKRI